MINRIFIFKQRWFWLYMSGSMKDPCAHTYLAKSGEKNKPGKTYKYWTTPVWIKRVYWLKGCWKGYQQDWAVDFQEQNQRWPKKKECPAKISLFIGWLKAEYKESRLRAYCKKHGHDLTCEADIGPESGSEYFYCNRCDYSEDIIYY